MISIHNQLNKRHGHSSTLSTLRWTELVVIIGLVFLCFATYQRNFLWKDDLSLWSDVVKKSPNKYRGYNEIGTWYLKKKLIDNAIPYFQKSISLNPGSGASHNNLGLCFLGKGLIDPAIEEFKQAIRTNPSDGMYHINLGMGYWLKGLNNLASNEMRIGKDLRRMQNKEPLPHHPKIQ